MVLTTERLLLREFVAEDWPAILAYQSDPRYLRYYEWTGRTPEEVQQFVRMFLEQQAEQPRRKFLLAVVLRADGRLIGSCGIRLKTSDAREGDIGYEVAPDEWGKGYATEAAHAIVDLRLWRTRPAPDLVVVYRRERRILACDGKAGYVPRRPTA